MKFKFMSKNVASDKKEAEANQITIFYSVCNNPVVAQFSSVDCDHLKLTSTKDKNLEQKLTGENTEKDTVYLISFARPEEPTHAFHVEKANSFQSGVARQILSDLLAVKKVYFNKGFFRIEKFADTNASWTDLFPILQIIIKRHLPGGHAVVFKKE